MNEVDPLRVRATLALKRATARRDWHSKDGNWMRRRCSWRRAGVAVVERTVNAFLSCSRCTSLDVCAHVQRGGGMGGERIY
jgi:hypothetical protein